MSTITRVGSSVRRSQRRRGRLSRARALLVLILWSLSVGGWATAAEPAVEAYAVQPGDVLTVFVWNEKDLQGDVLVRSDGGLSFPLTGDVQAAGRTVEEVRLLIQKSLKPYLPDAVVSVSVKQIGGNFIYVIGKVNKPGQFAFAKPPDVMQALSLAGGMTPYAAANNIRILRREASGLKSMPFQYKEIEQGRHFEQNIVLRSGDTVVVP